MADGGGRAATRGVANARRGGLEEGRPELDLIYLFESQWQQTPYPARSRNPVPASEYDSELDQYFSDAEARDRVAGVVHDAVQQAVMQYGYDDELFQDWRDGKIGEKDLPEEVMAMTLDLCERWRAEQERCRRVHAAQRLSRDHSAPTLAALLVSGSDQGEGTD